MTIKATVKYNNRLTEIQRALSVPVQEIGLFLMREMVQRIKRGVGASGLFRPLGADSRPRPGPGLFWVSPTRPQPAGYVARPTSGPKAGWAGYESYKAYVDALGKPARTFEETGALLDSLGIRVMGPGRVKVTFYGRHKAPEAFGPTDTPRPQSNTSVAFLGSRGEREPMLMPTAQELTQVGRIMRERMTEMAEAAAGQGAVTRRAPRKRAGT